MGLNFCRALLLLLIVVAGVPGAWAQGELQWELSADRLSHQEEPEGRLVLAEGGVVLSRPAAAGGALTIKADRISYYPDRGLVEARGRVSIESPDEEVAAEAASLSLRDETGALTRATIFLPASGLYIKGGSIEKTGEVTYELRDAWLSACHPDEDCPPAWSFTSKRAKITLEGMAHLYHSAFRIRETPTAYLPYLLLPAKIKRQSGFLFPEWSRSRRDGLGVALPYFINLSPSADLTLHPRYLEHRGLLAAAEFRYAAGPDSRGMLVASFLKDKTVDDETYDFKNDGLLRSTTNRYWVRGKADHDFGDNLIGRLDLDLVSDQDFIQEFDSGSLGYPTLDREFNETFGRDLLEPSLTTRQSALQLGKTRDNLVLTGELRLQQDSRHEKQAVSPLQSLPRLNFAARAPLRQRSSSLALNSEYVHYWRSRGIAAHRLDLHPQLVTPMPRAGGWLEGRLTTGARQTMYQVTEHGDDYHWEHERYQDRSAVDVEANLATTLVRDFALSRGLDGQVEAAQPYHRRWLEHMVRPNLSYTYLNRTDEEKLPRLDAVDRLERKEWLTYELSNYFELAGIKAGADGQPGDFTSRSLAFFQVAQTYNLREKWRENLAPDEEGRELSDLRFELQLDPWSNLNLRYQTNLSVYGLGVTRYELRGGYRPGRGGSFSVNYRYLKYDRMVEPYFYTTRGEEMHDIVVRFNTPVTSAISLYGMLNQSLSEDHIAEASVGVRYQPHCWAVDLEVRRYLEEKSVMIVFTLDSIGQFLRGSKKGI